MADFSNNFPTPTMKLRGKRVLVIANVGWNVFNFRQNLLSALIEEGASVYVAAAADTFVQPLVDLFPSLHFLPLQHLRRGMSHPMEEVLLLAELRRLFHQVKPDFSIHYTVKPNIYAGLVAQRQRIPYFSVITGLGFSLTHTGWLQPITKQLYAWSLRKSAKVLFENEDNLSFFVQQRLIQSSQGIAVKGCGVNVDFFKPSDTPSKHVGFVFSYIGRLLYDKGLRELVGAFQSIYTEFPDTRLQMIGNRDEDNPACVTSNDIRLWRHSPGVELYPWASDVRPFLEATDCVVYPSYSEGMPRLVLEAMAMGKPVITTRTPGCRETIIDVEQGLLVEAKSVDALAAGMKTLRKASSEERTTMGRRARERAKNVFEASLIAQRLISVFSENL